MSSRLPLAVAILCSLGLAGFQQAPEGYAIDFPAGWSPAQTPDPNLASSVAADGRTNCNAQSIRIAALDDMSQAEINAEQERPYDAASWANFIGVDPEFIVVHESETRRRDDHYVQIATLKIEAGAMDNEEPVMAQMGAIVLVGRVVTAGCYAQMEAYPQVATQFARTIGSLQAR